MKRLLLTVCVFFVILSCSEDDSENQEVQNENFYALTVGNSWQYRWYAFNPASQSGASPSNITETISVVGTELIDGNLYYQFQKEVDGNDLGGNIFPDNGLYTEFYRDSLGFLINQFGAIKFVNNTTDEFTIYDYEPNNYAAFGQLSNGTTEFTTVAGTFDCLEMKIRYEDESGNEMPAVNRHYYADSIGLIKDEIVFIASQERAGYQRRLESYDLQ